MSFTVSKFVADSNDKVVSIDWAYTNPVGTITNTHVLSTPAGEHAFDEITQETLVGWLTEQLESSTEDLDKALDNFKAQLEYQASLKVYERGEDDTYAILKEEATEEAAS